MFMYDVSADLKTFYDKHVRLGSERRKQLADYRDLNISRLKNGLDDLAKSENGPTYKQYLSGASALPKGVALKFSVVSTNVLLPYNVRWIIDNEGDEASEAQQLHWENIDSGTIMWTSTAFKGTHRMIC